MADIGTGELNTKPVEKKNWGEKIVDNIVQKLGYGALPTVPEGQFFPDTNGEKPQPDEVMKVPEPAREAVTFDQLPESIRDNANLKFLMNEPERIWKQGEIYTFQYHLTDETGLFEEGQDISVAVALNPNLVSQATINGCLIVPVVNGQPCDLVAKGRQNLDTISNISWNGGFDTDRTDEVSVTSDNTFLLRVKKMQDAEDLVAYFHESSHTLQPAEMVRNTDNEPDPTKKAFYSRALEKDAWNETRTTFDLLDIKVNTKRLDEIQEHFEKIYENKHRNVKVAGGGLIGEFFNVLEKTPIPRVSQIEDEFTKFTANLKQEVEAKK